MKEMILVEEFSEVRLPLEVAPFLFGLEEKIFEEMKGELGIRVDRGTGRKPEVVIDYQLFPSPGRIHAYNWLCAAYQARRQGQDRFFQEPPPALLKEFPHIRDLLQGVTTDEDFMHLEALIYAFWGRGMDYPKDVIQQTG